MIPLACIVCGQGDHAPYSPGVRRCLTCGHVFAEVRLSDEEVAALYCRDYFFGNEYLDYVRDRAVQERNFGLRLAVLAQFLDPARHRHLLEIGSAFGFFLRMARERFATVRGIEISDVGSRYSREELGINVSQEDFLKTQPGYPLPDVVCLWDVIEHLREPHLTLEKIGRDTQAGALLAFTTGDIESLNARLRRGRWRLIHPPTHLHYFSRRTLVRLLDRAGFDVVYSRPAGYYRSVDGMAWGILALSGTAPRAYERLRSWGLLRRDLYMNLYDILYVVARRR